MIFIKDGVEMEVADVATSVFLRDGWTEKKEEAKAEQEVSAPKRGRKKATE